MATTLYTVANFYAHCKDWISMIYINWKVSGKVETVDRFETRKEAKAAIPEYQMAYGYQGEVYLSSRCTKEWSNK